MIKIQIFENIFLEIHGDSLIFLEDKGAKNYPQMALFWKKH